MIKKCLFFVFLFITLLIRADGVDSLKLLLGLPSHDTLTVLKIIKLAQKNTGNNPNEALDGLRQGLKIAKQINYKAGLAKSYLAIGYAFRSMSEFDSAKYYYLKSIDILILLERNKDLITAYNNMGVVEKEKGKFSQAINYYIKSLNIADKLNDKRGQGRANSNIGIVYRNMKNYDKALEYQLKAHHFDSLGNEKNSIGKTFANIGNIYLDKKDYKLAANYFESSIKIFKETDDKASLAIIYNNAGEVYALLKDFKKAKQYAHTGFELGRQINDPSLIAYSLLLLGGLNEKQEFYIESEKNYLEAATIFEQIGNKNRLKDVYFELATMYRKRKHFEKAIDYFEKSNNIKDSLFNSDFSKQITEMEQKYQSGEKQKQIEILKQHESINDLQLKKKNITICAAFILGFGLLVFMGMIYRNLNQKKKINSLLEKQNAEITNQKGVIEEKNKDIVDSLNYAQRLQENILPPEDVVKKLLPESFVFYKPKDIVSGDFYWIEQHENDIYIATVDCTGHGIPGAIMSIVGNNLLNKILREDKITSCEKILDSLVINLVQYLRQDGNNEKISNDGMDITLCKINFQSMHVQFSGAYNPLILVSNSTLTEHKVDKFSIGRHTYEAGNKFKERTLRLEKGSMLYLFSDGYVDQFGGKNGKKFMRKNFYSMLKEISPLTTDEQNQILETRFYDWKNNTTQVDDVLVIGIRI